MDQHPALTEGRVAVVTGAASGIGLAAAKRFAATGMRVCLADLGGEALDRAATEVTLSAKGAASDVLAVPTDVSQLDDVRRLKDRALDAFGEIAVLMNNAGVSAGGGPWDHYDGWQRVLSVNLWGVINGVQTFAQSMIDQATPGAIVNTGSKQGITCPPGNTAYNVTKAGVKVLTEGVAHSLRNVEGCRVSAHLLVPGSTFTGMTRRGRTEKPAGSWTPKQVVDRLIEGMAAGDFYIICPDNDVTRDVDNRRVLWAAEDIIRNRPPLSRWHPDYQDEFAAFLASEAPFRSGGGGDPRDKGPMMEYVKLGHTGLEVSRICLGCMSYGMPDRGNHAWSICEEEARPFIKRALEGGINFFDTANRYSAGSSEEILGRAIKDFARRDEVVIATKVYGRMRPGPNGGGVSRKAIMIEIDASLQRLGTDYVDLYQIHRWDHDTPIEETLEALHDIVKVGKARYLGASSMHARRFARALGVADLHGWTRFVSMQNLVNLLYREEEREMLPLCAAEGIGVIPWSTQARGRLTRDSDYTSIRTETDDAHQRLFAKTADADKKVIDRVAEVAAARGVARAQVALAWLLAKPVITAPIVGATKLHHLDDALSSVNVKLSPEEIALLEEPYVPHAVVGFV